MDLPRMLDKCRRNQWKVDDLDWKQSPRAMSPGDEEAIVQYFTDMAQIERLAGALFREQERRVDEPVLKEIFHTFVVDEVRHAHAAERLAEFYDVRRLRAYRPSVSLERFFPHFLDAIRLLADDVANVYITAGELILDIALLRSIDDYVDDPMSHQAMRLINRDESRHLAIDYHMVEFYASAAYREKAAAPKKTTLRERAHAFWTFGNLIYYAKPFFHDVFFVPMQLLDPEGARLREAFRRMELLQAKPGVADLPFTRFLITVRDTYNHPLGRRFVGPLAGRLAGVEPALLERLATAEDMRRAEAMSFDELAADAIAVNEAR